MELVLEFLVNNYIWFLVIALILVFALIGYLVDIKNDERFTKEITIDKEVESRLDVVAAANMTLNQMVQKQSEEIKESTPVTEPEKKVILSNNTFSSDIEEIPTNVEEAKE